MNGMTTRNTALAVLGILIIAIFLRTYHLSSLPPGLYPDEAMNGNNALEVLGSGDFSTEGGPASGWKVYYPENNGREGLFMNIQAVFLATFLKMTGGDPEPWMLRFASTVFGSFTVLGLYFLGRELFGRKAGLAASFFLATSFWHIMFSRIGFRAIMAPFFLVWASFFLIRAIRLGALPRRQLVFAAIGGLAFGLGFYSYIAYRVSPLLLLIVVPFFWRERRFWKTAGVFTVVAFFVALPIGLYYLANPADFMGRTTQVSVFGSPTVMKDLVLNIAKTAGMFNIAGDFNWRHNYAGRPELFWPVGLLFLAGLGYGAKRLFGALRHWTIFGTDRDESFAWKFTGAWFALAALPVVISNEGLPHALRAILMIPPTMIFAGAAAGAIYDRFVRGRFSIQTVVFGIAFAIAFLTVEAGTAYFKKWGGSPEAQGAFAANYVELGREIRALPKETPKYIVVEAGGVLVRGIPMPAQTVMFMTDSFTPEKQREKNIHYVLPPDRESIPAGARVFEIR